jgi:hypothetical protein
LTATWSASWKLRSLLSDFLDMSSLAVAREAGVKDTVYLSAASTVGVPPGMWLEFA